MKNEKLTKEQISLCLDYFLTGQLLNIPMSAIMFMPMIFWGAAADGPCNAYIWSDLAEGLFATIGLFIMVIICQMVGFRYLLKKLDETGEHDVKSVVLRKLPLLLIGVFLAIFFMFMDFSPSALKDAKEYKEYLKEFEVSEEIFQGHLKQLPDDVEDQSFGAYILTLNEGEAFATYLTSHPDTLYKDKLSALHLNKEENAVLNYFHQLNPSMTSPQQNQLALNLYYEFARSFVRNLNGDWEEGLVDLDETRSLYEHIIGFEVVYFEHLVYYNREEMDENILASSLKEIIRRLEYAKTLSELHPEEIAALDHHQSFYMDCLAQLNGGIENVSLSEKIFNYQKEEALETHQLQPYVKIVGYLIGNTF